MTWHGFTSVTLKSEDPYVFALGQP